jgi:transglutaminase-like putative cysteine protease
VVLVAFLLSALLYIVWSHYRVREKDWIRQRVVFHAGTRFDFLQAGLLAVLVVTPVAWVLPNLPAGGALREYTRPIDAAWQRVQDGWTQLYASLTSYGGEYADPYGNTLALGGPRRILPRVVMDVRANAGRYWRAVVYDEYTGAGWTSTAETRLIVSPDEPLRLPRYFQTQMITATFTNFMPDSGLIYFPHQPAGTDRQAKFSVFSLEDGPYDIAKTLSRFVIYEGKSYQAWGTVSTARADPLRRAGTDYPYWVRERYLQLPADMSTQVSDLAATIAAPHTTPYDQADALTNWLRTNIAYNEAAEAAPVDTDPLEYLLFESQEGYCNYYAAALAVMLRSKGIPARMVAGYARGTWQAELGIYRVHSSDAHTWVEVFFPGFGWVEFEPTAAQPAIVRTPPSGTESSRAGADERDRSLQEAGPDLLEGDEWGEQLPEEGGGLSWVEFLSSTPGLILAGAVVLALATGVAALLLGRQSTRGMSVVTQVYDRMSRFGRWLRVQLLPSQTPYERAALLTAAAPKATAPIDVITDLYVEERFGQDREGTFDERAVRAWRELWPALLQESVLRYLARFQPDRTDVGRSRKVRRG